VSSIGAFARVLQARRKQQFLTQALKEGSAQMREYVVTGTSEGRLTHPAVVRRKLGINAGDGASFVIEHENGTRPRQIDDDVSSVRW